MNQQEEVYNQLNGILHKYVSTHGRSTELAKAIHRIMEHRGITNDLPMAPTAMVLIARDVLRVWEGS